MKWFGLIVALTVSASAFGALPGVSEFRDAPEHIPDAALAAVLDTRVAAADVVAIGETVHGSAGFLRMQARLVRYLVERHGMRLIVWENPTLRSLELARWVAACTAARTPVPVDVLYMPTTADLVLFDWICDYNRARPGAPVVFRGMDVWDRPWEHYARIAQGRVRAGIDAAPIDAVERSCPAARATSWRQIDAAYEALQRDGRFLSAAGYERCRAALAAILDASRRLGAKSAGAAAEDAFELALSASTLLGWLGFHHHSGSDDLLSWNERDLAQGRNLMLLMERHGVSRAILSAHTSHVSHNRSPADWWGSGDLKSGVHFFRKLTGKTVFNIALTAYQASGTQGAWLLPTAANSLDRTLHEAGHTLAFFLSDAPFLSAHRTWWVQNGNAERFDNGIELVPRDHFDAFVFFDRSLLDHALPQRDMWQP